MSRVGLGRHSQLDSDAGDPLDGLINLFDVGLVLAVAFLIAGLSMNVDAKTGKLQRKPEPTQQTTLSTPPNAQTASGQGTPVGQAYRLPDGRVVLVAPGATP